jgi:hypothetical protein
MNPSDFSHRLIPAFPFRLYLPYLRAIAISQDPVEDDARSPSVSQPAFRLHPDPNQPCYPSRVISRLWSPYLLRHILPHRGIELPPDEGGSLVAPPTSGSLSLRAEDRLRFFLTEDTLPLLASAPLQVNSMGGILTLWLVRLRGALHPTTEAAGFLRGEAAIRAEKEKILSLFLCYVEQ